MTFKKRLIVLVGAGGASGTVKTVLDGGVMTATINLHGLSGTGYELAVFSDGVAARYELFGDVTREKTLRLNGETDADNAHFAVYDGSGNAVVYGTRARERMKSLPVLPKKGERDATSESDKKAIATAKEPFRYSTTENLFGDIFPSGEGYADNAVASVNYYARPAEEVNEQGIRVAYVGGKPSENAASSVFELGRSYIKSISASRASVSAQSFSAARGISDIQADYVRSLRSACRAHTARTQATGAMPQVAARETPIKGRKLAFYERIAGKIDELFKNGERDEALEKLLPQSKCVKVNYSETKSFSVGLIGEKPDYVCYALPGAFGSPAPEYLGEAAFLPLDSSDPEGKGYWLLYQNAQDGSSVKLDS